ncbi:hypothetical protein J7E88_01070 [Streptomyces sp. ISL-10]|nr:hypothetical protein [Streptomyces sp. ISL-10]MBT2363959.1 hypothetical protein [Streptomyces sp. ISL-10]
MPAKTCDASAPEAARKFTAKEREARIAGRVWDFLSTPISSNGGEAETAHTVLQVNPRGSPSSSIAVMTATAVGKEPKISRNCWEVTGM